MHETWPSWNAECARWKEPDVLQLDLVAATVFFPTTCALLISQEVCRQISYAWLSWDSSEHFVKRDGRALAHNTLEEMRILAVKRMAAGEHP
ncbi:MAG TPA: hypothetical protein VHS97_01900, partial [Isosphaeraceae bacterium]|nr:hypothetical protein [Isosphaeraceae bacterium]